MATALDFFSSQGQPEEAPIAVAQEQPRQKASAKDFFSTAEQRPSFGEKVGTFLNEASKFQESYLGGGQAQQAQEDPGYLAGAKEKITETIKGIPQIPRKIAEGVKAFPQIAQHAQEQLLREPPTTKEGLRERIMEFEKSGKIAADIGSLGFGPVGFAATRAAKGIGLRAQGKTKKEIGAELAGDALAYGSVLGTRAFIKKMTGKSVFEIKKTKSVEVDPTKVKDLYSRVTTGGPVSPQEQAIYQSLADSGQLSSALKQSRPFKIEIPKGVPKIKPVRPTKPVGPKVSGLPAEILKPPVKPFKPPVFPQPKVKGAEVPAVKPGEDVLGITPPSYKDAEKVILAVRKGLKKASATFDVEKPFRDAGAPETGLAIKTMPSKMRLGEEKSLEFVKKVNEMGLSESELKNLAFMVEKSVPTTPKAQKAVDFVQQELKADLDILKKRGELKTGFPESMIERLEAEKPHLTATQLAETNKKIARLKEIDYIPIQYKILLEEEMNERLAEGKSLAGLPSTSGKFASLEKIKGRRSITLKDLVDAGLVPKEKADARQLVASYKRFISNKLAERDIIDSGIKEGLGVPAGKAPENFAEMPTRYSAGIKGYKWDPLFTDYMASTYRAIGGPQGVVAKATAMAKMMQFYNPLFLPLNDVMQGAMLGSMFDRKLPGNIRKAWEMASKKTPEYYEALENGLASTPHKNPWSVYKKELDRITTGPETFEKKLIGKVKQYAKSGGVDAIGDLYSLSWNVAWKLDRAVRLVSYNHLRGKGHSPRDAAQIAASFHGDYAGVPAKTRKALNKVLFTPTFKIAMGKLYGSMLKGAFEQASGAGSKVKGAYAKGLALIFAVTMGRRLMLKKMGFKEKEYNRKFVLESKTNQGVPKDITVNFADPTNIVERYIYRFGKLRPGETNWFSKVGRGLQYELNPLWRLPISLSQNKKSDGTQVFKPFDNPKDQLLDVSKHIIGEMVGITKPVIQGKTKKKKELRELIKNSAYPEFLNILKFYSFQYGGDLDFIKNARTINKVTREFRTNERKYFQEEDTKGFENRLKNYEKIIMKLTTEEKKGK